MALVLGEAWSKARTLEIYLNIAEWGDGIYGIEAAAQRYFHKSASQLNPREAALLATALPNPILRNPARPLACSAGSPPASKRKRAKAPICSNACRGSAGAAPGGGKQRTAAE